MTSLKIAYLLWLPPFGLFGLHHFYLKRDRHAFVWFCTFGGFILGWVREFWRLPAYVQERLVQKDSYIDDDDNVNKYAYLYDEDFINRSRKPNASLVRLGGMAVMGYLFGYLVLFAYPPFFNAVLHESVFSNLSDFVKIENIGPAIAHLKLVILAFAVATGVYVVGNIGQLQASWWWCLASAAIGGLSQLRHQFLVTVFGPTLASSLATGTTFSLEVSCIVATAVVSLTGLSRRPPGNRCLKNKRKRLIVLIACGAAYFILWGCTMHFSDTITAEEANERALLTGVISYVRRHYLWGKAKKQVEQMWETTKIKVSSWFQYRDRTKSHAGDENSDSSLFQRLWKYVFGDSEYEEFIEPHFGPEERNPFVILDVRRSARKPEIKRAYTQLMKIFHPDKYRSEYSRRRAHNICIQINNAYEQLAKKIKWRD